MALTQETIDASRTPLTEEERAVYNLIGREWFPASGLSEGILDILVEKGWVDKTYDALAGEWVYQRRHSLED